MRKEEAIKILEAVADEFSDDRWSTMLDQCGDNSPRQDTYEAGFQDAYFVLSQIMCCWVNNEIDSAHLDDKRFLTVDDYIAIWKKHDQSS